MCGIAGILSFNNPNDHKSKIKEMVSSLKHRGPDSLGYWVSNCEKIHLGHSRLSILDLSSSGDQPMVSFNKKSVLIFNGEIYNYKNILKKLPSALQKKLIDEGDTRVLLETIHYYGLKKTLEMVSGMFAFALLDTISNKIFLVRDRFGEKPLYYGITPEGIVFSSETKAIKVFCSNLSLNLEAAIAFLNLSYIPAPLSIYKEVRKVEAGSFIEIDTKKVNNSLIQEWTRFSLFKSVEWWSPYKEIETLKKSKLKNVGLNNVEKALSKSVEEKMISDRPLGAFLSGGIDSSLIVAKMQELQKRKKKEPVKTFTIGFKEKQYDESKFAELVANHLGSNHKTFFVSHKDLIKQSKNIAKVYDEPFADSSQIPTLILCSRVSEEVTVALSGDGGDEIFGGYRRYFLLDWKYKLFKISPKWIKILISNFLQLSLSLLNFGSKRLKINILNRKYLEKISTLSYRMRNIQTTNDLYYSLLADTKFVKRVLNPFLPNRDFRPFLKSDEESRFSNEKEHLMYLDTCNYLEGDILVKVDRAAMHFSLETRAPFLDTDVFQSAWQLPVNEKVSNGEGKIPLKKILSKYLPRKLIYRPKAGFALPLEEWLRGPLEKWGRKVIFSEKLDIDLFNYSELEKVWSEHKNGKIDHSRGLWAVLMFHLWYKENKI